MLYCVRLTFKIDFTSQVCLGLSTPPPLPRKKERKKVLLLRSSNVNKRNSCHPSLLIKKNGVQEAKAGKAELVRPVFQKQTKTSTTTNVTKITLTARGISIVFKEMFSKNLVMVFSIAQWSKRTGVMPRTLNEHLKKDMTFTLSALVFEAVWFSKTRFQSTL